jgi:hypothetical protein
MKLLVLTIVLSVVWAAVLALLLTGAPARDAAVRRRLVASVGLAVVSVAIWFLWFQIRFTVHPLDFVGYWKMVGRCLVGIVTSIASAICAPFSGKTRTAWMVCALFMVGIFFLTVIVSIPVS